MDWTDDKVIKLIGLYRSRPVLWNPSHSDYKKRPTRVDAFNEIAAELSISVAEAERKIKNITCHYYREKKRIDRSKHSLTIYRTKWFAYKPLSFLSKKYSPVGVDDTHNVAKVWLQSETDTQCKKKEELTKDDIVAEALSIMRNVTESQIAYNQKDEDSLFGEYIASQLRKMDQSSKAVVRHRINNVIFEAETGFQAETGYRADDFGEFAKPCIDNVCTVDAAQNLCKITCEMDDE